MSSGKRIVLVVLTDVVPEMEEQFNRWYNEEHIPRLLQVPGVHPYLRNFVRENL